MGDLLKIYRDSIKLAKSCAQSYSKQGVTFFAPAFYPTRLLSTVDFLSKNGVDVVMAGGGPGKKFFSNVPQYSMPYDTTGLDESEENINAILNQVPKDSVNGNVAILLYNSVLEGDRLWEKCIRERFGVDIVGSNEQNISSFFEEKTNLSDILIKAGLQKHIIPSTIIKEPKSSLELMMMYKELKDENGRIVIQACGPNVNDIGGGHSTIIAKNFKEFYDACQIEKGYVKVAHFVEGVNSNVSMCAGNLLQSKGSMGAFKGELLPEESRYSSETLDSLLQRGSEVGLTQENTFCLVQPGTLKVVGDKNLTTLDANSVGNQINYRYPQEVLDKVYDIGSKLGNVMALCGKVGLFGMDLIISKDGNIYINEINDRQQGPTETASLNNEKHSLPSIQRIAFLQSYADFSQPQVQEFMSNIKDNSRNLYDASTHISSPFYIKLMGKRVGKPDISKVDLGEGVYRVTKDQTGKYEWDLTSKRIEDEECPVDLDSPENFISINSVSLARGQQIVEGTQILRISGFSEEGSEPFGIQNGESILEPKWANLTDALYEKLFEQQDEDPLQQGAIPDSISSLTIMHGYSPVGQSISLEQ